MVPVGTSKPPGTTMQHVSHVLVAVLRPGVQLARSGLVRFWTLVAKGSTSMGRKKSTEDKKKRDMGAPGTLETVNPTVEGSSDNRHTGSGASVGKSQSETLSQSEKSLGEKYRDNRENLLSDTLRYKGATPGRSSSLATPVSTDLRVDTSPVLSRSSVHWSPVKRTSRHRSPVDQATRHRSQVDQAAGHQSTSQPDIGHLLGLQTSGHLVFRQRDISQMSALK